MNRLNKNNIKVFEHQTLIVDENGKFRYHHFNALEKYGYRTNEKYFAVGNNRIKFSNYVGVIQVKNLTIEILPKADYQEQNEATEQKWQNALLVMLNECKLIKLNSISNARLKIQSASILDLYFDLFLTETEKLVREGLDKSYKTEKSNLDKIKGKIKFSEQIKRNFIHKEKFFVEYKTYNKNNKLNQILLKALIILSNISNNPIFNIRIKRLVFNFTDIEVKNITSSWFDNIYYNRNNERYKQAVNLAKLIILKYSPDLKGGNDNILAILFDMNRLYENYIYRKLKVLEKEPNIPIIKIYEQKRKPFWGTRGIKPDILIQTQDANFIIDTKWKILLDNRPSDNDIKQMFVYNLHYDTKLSILLYPKLNQENLKKTPFREDKFSKLFCKTAFSDLFNSQGNLIKDLGYKLYDDILKNEIVYKSS